MKKWTAKAISLEVWRYFVEHPEICYKDGLPDGLFDKIADLWCQCPLCELFRVEEDEECPGCPLSGPGYYCVSEGAPFDRWNEAGTEAARKAAAEEIVRCIAAWEVEEGA